MSDIHKKSKKYILTPAGAVACVNGDYYSDLIFSLPGFVAAPQKSYVTISPAGGIFPASYYNVEPYNNTFVLYANSTTYTFIIPAGNYNYYTLQTAFTNAANGSTLPSGFSVGFSLTSGMYTFNYTSAFSIQSSSTCFDIIGGVPKTTYTSSGNAITMPYAANFLGPTRIFVESPTLTLENKNTNSLCSSSFLMDILVTGGPGDVTVHNDNYDVEYFVDNPSDTTTLHIQIKDEDGNLLNFRKRPWSIGFIVNVYTDIIPWSQSIPDFLRNVLQPFFNNQSHPALQDAAAVSSQNQSQNSKPKSNKRSRFNETSTTTQLDNTVDNPTVDITISTN